MRKLAIKRLTNSDLTLFEWQFKTKANSNQKAINLDKDVFIQSLYPGLTNLATKRIAVDTFIYGPGLEGEYNLQRKIILSDKNWRLNGEYICNPEGSALRFNILDKGDFAVFSFIGDLKPTIVKIVFISKNAPEDVSLHSIFNQALDKSSMIAVTEYELDEYIRRAKPQLDHPIYEMSIDENIEDAAFNGIEGIKQLINTPSRRRISREVLQQAKENANRIGFIGEQLVRDYLVNLQDNNIIKSFEWVSDYNAISPYDFYTISNDNTKTLLDVKATEGDFSRKIHISMSELLQIANGAEPYVIYRIFVIGADQAKLRISGDIRDFARSILATLANLQNGVFADSLSVDPITMPFGEEIEIDIIE